VRAQLLAPGREVRAVDALPAQQRSDRSGLTTGECGVGGFDDPQLLRGRVPPACLRGARFDRGSARAAIALLARRFGRTLTTRDEGWLGHVEDHSPPVGTLISRGGCLTRRWHTGGWRSAP